MSRNAILRLITAAITVAILAALHQGLGWFLDRITPDFATWMVIAAFGITILFAIGLWMDRSATFGRGQQKRTRDKIDM